MSKQNDVDRLQRLREQQLRARDPQKKDQKKMQRLHAKHGHRNQLTLKQILREIRGGWWGMLVGGLLGAVLALAIGQGIDLSPLAGAVIIFVGVAIGRVVGTVMDWRDDDHSQMTGRRRR